ncbi:hypothetical protein [Gorillibacterium sp. sgz5001074]|uniref:hypothetical protein n=1 Tax=Gorillibacterium sp. sgz5001074 TaxID=3446695 RepID=UPI003F66914C
MNNNESHNLQFTANKYEKGDYFVSLVVENEVFNQIGIKKLNITYIPDAKLVEAHSLERYIKENVRSFSEDELQKNINQLSQLIQPRFIEFIITPLFAPQHELFYVNWGKKGTKYEEMAYHRSLNKEWFMRSRSATLQ